ncbi:Hypothetical predicted protein [Mytilus galloprovincialis]|nr:Hypothetical predicted protein [Mytilus galloprovincialis]
MSNVTFEQKWSCGISSTKPECAILMNNFSKEPMTEYRCRRCNENHTFIDEWSEQQNKTPGIAEVSENVPRSNPYTESSSQSQTTGISTKIFYLYSELRNINKHIPTNRWGGNWQNIQITDIAIGDDIERIQLTRNELQHSRTFVLDDTCFNELLNIIVGIVNRFDQHNKPAKLYKFHLNEILAKTVSSEEVKVLQQLIKNEIELGMAVEFEIEHRLNILPH